MFELGVSRSSEFCYWVWLESWRLLVRDLLVVCNCRPIFAVVGCDFSFIVVASLSGCPVPDARLIGSGVLN